MASGNDSDDPINAFAEDDKAAQRRHGTPSGATTFPPIEQRQALFEPKFPPLAPFLKPTKRIANMKNKVRNAQTEALASAQLMWTFRMGSTEKISSLRAPRNPFFPSLDQQILYLNPLSLGKVYRK